MIDEKKTFDRFGYTSDQLSKGSHKLVVRSCDDCNKLNDVMYFYGFFRICQSCAAKKRMREKGHPLKGTHLSEETKIKQSCSTRGISIDNFGGFVSSERSKFSRSDEYNEWRSSIFERDNYTCQECGHRGGNLNAHHILPYRDWKEEKYSLNIDNGITLCTECHQKTYGKEYEFFSEYFDIIHGVNII